MSKTSNVPNTQPIASGNVPSTQPIASGNAPSTQPIAATDALTTIRPKQPAPVERLTTRDGVWRQADHIDFNGPVWPPLGRQSDGTFIWQYGPEWLKMLWGVES